MTGEILRGWSSDEFEVVYNAAEEALLWGSFSDELDDDLRGQPVVREATDGLMADLQSFLEEIDRANLCFYVRRRVADMGKGLGQLGHDYVMSRMGHGVGLWEDEWGRYAPMLDGIAQAQGDLDAYLGDDGYVYFEGVKR